MPRKRKMIEIDDLLNDQPDQGNDMIFITATENPEPTKSEIQHMSRLERIRSAAVEVDEPIFDGITDLDLGKISLGNEEDALRIKKRLLEQERITKASDEQRDTIIEEMNGVEPEDVVEQFNLDIPFETAEPVDRENVKRVNREAVNEILKDLLKE